jgi:hypothetical protein
MLSMTELISALEKAKFESIGSLVTCQHFSYLLKIESYSDCHTEPNTTVRVNLLTDAVLLTRSRNSLTLLNKEL